MSEAVKITIDDLTATAAELRRLHAELERKSDAIQRLWKERDELRALNAELVEALRDLEWAASGVEYMESEYTNELNKARAALAKVENAAIRSRT